MKRKEKNIQQANENDILWRQTGSGEERQQGRWYNRRENSKKKNLFITFHTHVVVWNISRIKLFKKENVATPLRFYVYALRWARTLFSRYSSVGERVTKLGCQCFLLCWCSSSCCSPGPTSGCELVRPAVPMDSEQHALSRGVKHPECSASSFNTSTFIETDWPHQINMCWWHFISFLSSKHVYLTLTYQQGSK